MTAFVLSLSCALPQGDSGAPESFGDPGTFEVAFEHDGVTRATVVVVPESAEPGAPLLLNFHGFGGEAIDHLLWADLRAIAQEEGLILAYPQGTELDGGTHWNAALDGPDNKSEADDLGFTRTLIDTIDRSYALDRSRVYAVGYSNGGMFAYALACYAGDLVAAVGAVSGTMLEGTAETCEAPGPTPVLSFHGTADGVLPYEGGGGGVGAIESAAWWAGFNGIEGEPQSTTDGALTRLIWADGDGGSEVHHYRVQGGDHVWFDEDFEGQSVNALIWDFFARFDTDGLR